MDQRVHRPPEDLLRREPERERGGRVQEGGAAVSVHPPHALRGGFEEGRLLLPLALGLLEEGDAAEGGRDEVAQGLGVTHLVRTEGLLGGRA